MHQIHLASAAPFRAVWEVTPCDGQWRVRRGGARHGTLHATRGEAVARAVALAAEDPRGEVAVADGHGAVVWTWRSGQRRTAELAARGAER